MSNTGDKIRKLFPALTNAKVKNDIHLIEADLVADAFFELEELQRLAEVGKALEYAVKEGFCFALPCNVEDAEFTIDADEMKVLLGWYGYKRQLEKEESHE